MLVTVDRDPKYAPCCYLICKVHGVQGNHNWDTRNEAETVLVQTDWDWPGIASNLGFVQDETGDGSDIEAARAFLDDHLGEVFEDPGYFA